MNFSNNLNLFLLLKNIFEEKELEENSVVKECLTTAKDGKNYKTKSHEKALEKAHKEYDKYMKNHLTQAEKDYLEIMGEDIKKLK